MEELPIGFEDSMRKLLKDEADDFLSAMKKEAAVSVRLNRRKPGAEFPEGRPVKWCTSGYYLSERPQFIFDPLLHAGAYYVQDASSMIYETLASRLSEILLSERQDRMAPLSVLDLCAAPGGKTTAIINGIPDGSEVTANEISPKRYSILKENLAKWGYPVKITNRDSSFFLKEGKKYDIVAVDAPCSGEGMMRKDADARAQWSSSLIEKCASLQKEILRNAYEVVKPGGFLIYSTCTFNRKENEENAHYITEELGLLPFDPKFPAEWGIMRGIDTTLPVYRFMPHKTEGEGLFLAVFRKPKNPEDAECSLDNKKSGKRDWTLILKHKGAEKSGKPEMPEIEEFLMAGFNDQKFQKVEINLEDAQKYLRRESIVLPSGSPTGVVVVTYKNLVLGPVKNIGSRANNLYPKQWRILKRE